MTPTATTSPRSSASIISGPGLEADGEPFVAVERARGAHEARNIEDPTKPITAAQMADLLSGGPAGSGKTVTPRTSLKLAAVWACVRVIANAIARMPLVTYERTDRGRERAKGHPLYRLLKVRPNPDMSAFTFRNTLIANTLLWGNGYAEIVRHGDGTPQALIPVESERVTPFREQGELRYRVDNRDGRPVTLLRRDILHVPGMSFDGIVGLSVIAHAKQTIGAGLAADEFAGTLLRNGLRPSGVLQHPGKLGSAALGNLRESFTATYVSPTNAGKPLILEEGMTWHSAGMPLEDAQFIESSYFRTEDIARWFGVPPHKIGHLLRATNNNIEHQGLDFLGDTLAPWVECLQQELNWKLFEPDEQDRFYAEHLAQAIVLLDTDARIKLYKGLRDTTAISPDEIRERENLNNLPEGRGTVYVMDSSKMPAPTPEQADRLLEAWIKKGVGGKPSANGETGGEPKPAADDQVAKSG